MSINISIVVYALLTGFFLSCKKGPDVTATIAPTSFDTDSSIAHLNTPRLAGSHHWRREWLNACSPMPYWPFGFDKDTTVNIEVLNDSTIKVMNWVMKRVSRISSYVEDSTNYLYFTDSTASTNYTYAPSIAFKYTSDSMWFYHLRGCWYYRYSSQL
ncbi:MAG TPA: hypothetical protein VEB40_14095 [Flavipsychrobacter sp.]|nr:hypothetical protein [Flavipsychrobacter sp.]